MFRDIETNIGWIVLGLLIGVIAGTGFGCGAVDASHERERRLQAKYDALAIVCTGARQRQEAEQSE